MKETKTQQELNEHIKTQPNEWVIVSGGIFVAWGNSQVEAWDNSHVVARHNSQVEARGNSQVVAWENSHVEAWENSHVVATSPHVATIVKSRHVIVSGGVIIGNKPISAKDWLRLCNVVIKNQWVLLYKSLNDDMTSYGGFRFQIGKRHVAPDWNPDCTDECGQAIHYSPTVAQARAFRDQKTYVSCRVLISDIASLPAFAQYPDKIRARGGICLYRVDENGKRIEEPK